MSAPKLAVFVCSYSGEWVDSEGKFSPSEAIIAYMGQVANAVWDWCKENPSGQVFIVCNGGILVDGQYEGKRVCDALDRFPWDDGIDLVIQTDSWTSQTDLEMGKRTLELYCMQRYGISIVLEDMEEWDVMVACATAYVRKTRAIARYMLAGREVEVVHYPVGGNGLKIRLKQIVSHLQEIRALAAEVYTPKDLWRLKQIEATPGLEAPPLLLQRCAQ